MIFVGRFLVRNSLPLLMNKIATTIKQGKAVHLIVYITVAMYAFQGCSSPEPEEQSENPFLGLPEIETEIVMDITDEEASASGTFHFSRDHFHHMAFGPDGDMFVTNRGEYTILHFDGEGDFLGFIGRKGEGPGEFQIWPTFDNLSPDTLYALDYRSMQISQFVRRESGWMYEDGFVLDQKQNFDPRGIYQVGHEELVIEYVPNIQHLMNYSDEDTLFTRTVDVMSTSGEMERDNWLDIPADERSIYTSDTGAGIIYPLPYGSASILDIGPNNRLYHLWTCNFRIDVYNTGNPKVGRISHPSFHPVVSKEIRQSEIDNYSGARFGSEQEQRQMLQFLFDQIPTTAPSLKDMHVDRDTGHIIVRRHLPGDDPNWMLLDKEGKRVGVFSLEENLEVFDFRHSRILGALDREVELPTVRVVSIKRLE